MNVWLIFPTSVLPLGQCPTRSDQSTFPLGSLVNNFIGLRLRARKIVRSNYTNIRNLAQYYSTYMATPLCLLVTLLLSTFKTDTKPYGQTNNKQNPSQTLCTIFINILSYV
jgi:hypothetical protein